MENYTPITDVQSANDTIVKIFSSKDRPNKKNKKNTEDNEIELSKNRALGIISNFSGVLLTCTVGLLEYLHRFGFESLLFLDCNYYRFTENQYMQLDAATLRNLEVFHNPSSGAFGRGTLFWAINHTSTAMGKRLLIDWLKKPLYNPLRIKQRLDAVEELTTLSDGPAMDFFNCLSKTPDLERGICRVYYKKCSTQEFLAILRAFKTLSSVIPKPDSFHSFLLKEIFTTIPDLREDIEMFFDSMDEVALEKNDLSPVKLFKDNVFSELTEAKEAVLETEHTLDKFLKKVFNRSKKCQS